MKRRPKYLDIVLPIILATLGGLACFILIQGLLNQRLKKNKEEYLEDIKLQSEQIRSEIERRMIAKIYLAKSLTSYVSFNPDINEKAFNDFSSKVYEIAENEILSVQLVKDSIILYNYPQKGNEVTKGVNITQIAEDAEYVRRSIRNATPMLVGPRTLIQDKLGLVYRDPIVVDEGEQDSLWGYSAMVIDLEQFMQNLNSDSSLWSYALYTDQKGLDGSGYFYGNKEAAKDSDLKLEIKVMNDVWTIYIDAKLNNFYANQIFSSSQEITIFSGLISLVLGILVGLGLYSLIHLVAKNQIIEEQLGEKNTLIREVHHRIKNHFQLMNSINNVLYTDHEDQRVQEVILEINSRISSISEIYNQLGSHDSKPLNTRKYIESLSNNLLHGTSKKVKLDLNVGVDKLPVKKTAYMGVIINEMITNSLKYAFDAVSEGEIKISVEEEEEEISLEYFDNGGLLKAEDLGSISSKGIELMELFASQLGGNLKFNQKNGWVGYHMKFNKN